MTNDSSGQSIRIYCPWLGLCDDAEEIIGRKYEYCKGYYKSCPTWNEDPYFNSSSTTKTEEKEK